MKKYEKEVAQAQLDNEKEVLKKLEKHYEDALDEINDKIAQLLGRSDSDMSHVVYQVEFQKSLKKQVEAILETLHSNEFETVSEYLTKSYEEGFVGAMYELQKQGIPLVFPIDQEQIVEAIQTETNLSESLYTSMGKDIKDLQKKIAGEISRGIATGQMYSEMSRNIASWARIPKNNAVRIARTEAHRIQAKASMNACYKAQSKGADVVKEWDASLDAKTRDSHAKVNGEIRELDEPFSNKLMYPGDPDGEAGEVINCRCVLHQRARWALGNDYTKWSPDAPVVIDDDGTTQFTVIEAKNYQDFQKQYNQASERVRQDVQKMNDEEDYLKSKSAYDKEIERVRKLEKETDDLLDKYMDAMDTPDEARLEKLHSKKYEELESLKEIVKDLKAELSGKEAKAIRHIEKNLANMIGVDSSKINMTGLPYNSADMVYKSYKVVLNKYPELRGHLTQFDFDGVYGKAYAGCNAISGKVVAHGDFKDYDNIVEKYANDVAKKFHPEGTDHNSIIVHELGHALDGYMTKKGMLGGKITAYGIIRSATEVEEQVLDKLGWTFEKAKTLRGTLKAQGLSYGEINDEIRKQRNSFIKDHVSEYACDNVNEFFAECFAEYTMSDKPREAARIFGEIIEDALGR